MTTRLALAALAVGSAVAFAPRSTLLPRSAPTRAVSRDDRKRPTPYHSTIPKPPSDQAMNGGFYL